MSDPSVGLRKKALHAEKYSITQEGRKCVDCLEWKTWNNFGKDRSRSTGYTPRCKKCSVKHSRQMRINNPDRTLESKKRQLKKAGTSLEEYNELVMIQCGTCACCGELPEGYCGILVPHHNHENGKFIALICSACNIGMGKFKDNSSLMRRAADLNEESEVS